MLFFSGTFFKKTLSWATVRCVMLVIALNVTNAWTQDVRKQTNRLARESSPYLLQHAHNPVDWYPWGDEAFERAKRESKPVFLSIGYAACHWCHVMERESFVDQEIAKLLNENFICIKVDREERPDVDQIYMTAIQLLSGRGGWPLSVFLTPDAKPIFGGTYFPARDGDREGAPGFLTILRRVLELWRNEREGLVNQAERITQEVRRSIASDIQMPAGTGSQSSKQLIEEAVSRTAETLAEQFDNEYGGFGFVATNPMRPKFPEASNLFFLLNRIESKVTTAEQKTDSLKMLTKTLDGMLSGGIFDHLGGGFHRYSTDRFWRIPHFEKMLYDNGQLAQVYARAYAATGRHEYSFAAERICAFVLREMTAPGGAFYASLDADSEGHEGKFYVWSTADLEAAAKTVPNFELLSDIYGFTKPPNFEGHFAPQPGKTLTDLATERKQEFIQLNTNLTASRDKMLELRASRQRPATDDKILTAWNGLMIAGLADCGRLLKRPEFTDAAQKAANFVLQNLQASDGKLLRSYAGGASKLNGYLDDHAFLVYGILKLHQATADERWLDIAATLTDVQIKHFQNSNTGGFYYTSDDHPALIVRFSDPVDGAIPSGNSVTVANLNYLAFTANLERFEGELERSVRFGLSVLDRNPAASPFLAAELAHWSVRE